MYIAQCTLQYTIKLYKVLVGLDENSAMSGRGFYAVKASVEETHQLTELSCIIQGLHTVHIETQRRHLRDRPG